MVKGLLYKRALFYIADRLYHSFPFKDIMEHKDSFRGEFFSLGGLLEKGLDFGSPSKKMLDVGEQEFLV